MGEFQLGELDAAVNVQRHLGDDRDHCLDAGGLSRSGCDQFYFFSLMYMLFLIMVIAKIYFNDGRVQLFKSTSKLGDNHHCPTKGGRP